MSGLQRAMRHPDRINDPHARAHGLASEALLGPLEEADAAWLHEHLAGCAPCRATADSFAADAMLLRSLLADPPPVPRDLGARVSLALDQEVRRALRRPGRSRVLGGGVRRGSSNRSGFALAGLAAIALVALLVAPMVVPLAPTSPTPLAGASLAPEATPITVDTQPVAWVRKLADGSYVISSAVVDRVCPGVDASSCGTLDGSARTVASLGMKPTSVVLPRDGNPAVVVGQGGVYAVAVNLDAPVTTPRPDPSPVPASPPVQSPAATGESTSPPVGSPSPSETPVSPDVTATPTIPPTETTAPPPSEDPSNDPSAEPSGDPTSPEPGTPTPPPSGEPTPPVPPESPPPEQATPLPTLPPATPAPTAATALAIAEHVELVGGSPAYSPDGRWVAFSARPLDGTHGPDVYVWRVGERRARILTSDHASVYSGWLGGSILASSARVAGSSLRATEVPTGDTEPESVVGRSVLLDPASGVATPIPFDGLWLPVVDPTGRVVVFWDGKLAWSDDHRAWLPAAGRLVMVDWGAVRDGVADVELRPLPAAAAGTSIADWDVRFDPAGRRLGVWIADPDVPGTGRLSLLAIDADGSPGAVLLADASALPGFSLDADRLAWSTPPGRNGMGSQVTVFAWRGDAAGQLHGAPDPGDEPVVVAH